ncbi:MAG: hypothetical protein V4662_08030 [Verrucomicrobiota bacterium]
MPPSDATLAVIYRGLPHQMWAKNKLWHDLFTTSNHLSGGYRFYNTSVPASDVLRSSITAAIRSVLLYQPYRGPKRCGGYHPDFCFEWRSARGIFYALPCLGCHEIILIGDGTEVHCDLQNVPGNALETLVNQLNETNG